MFSDHPHRRYNPLTGSWVLVSPHRAKRPWLGQEEDVAADDRPAYDPGCYLCPGNERTSGIRNDKYNGVFVFENDFPAIMADGGDTPEEAGTGAGDLFRAEAVQGRCRVVCFSPDHSKTLPELSQAQIRGVVDAWAAQAEELGRMHKWVQLFENKGAAMGCSNPHPHGQVWAHDHVPQEVAVEDDCQKAWFAEHRTAMLLQAAEKEAGGPREVAVNDDWLAIVPWWAAWPFELLLLPRFGVQRITDLTGEQRDSLANILKRLTARYDNLFQTSFPYSMGWHGAPFDGEAHEHWQLHAHFYPPLLRSATVRKFMVGYEMMAEPQRDMTPEQAAARLREVGDVHYKEQQS